MGNQTRAQSPKHTVQSVRESPPAARRFWNWGRDETTGERTLYLDGVISEDTWWGDEITPAMFKSELFAEKGDITVWLNSPGGDCVAASQIYAMLMDYPHNVTVKIDGIAASAASVVAMAGTKVLMAPTALMMVHNPLTVAIGDSEEMQKAIDMLAEVKESIINAYEIKTGQSRVKISHWMDAETWMNANKAMELGFADGVLEDVKREQAAPTYAFSRRAVTNSLLDKLNPKATPKPTPQGISADVAKALPAEWLEQRLNLIQH